MRAGRCPKCGAETVHGARGRFRWGAAEKAMIQTSAITVGIELDTYICVTCGYLESYVPDPQKLAEVSRTWGLVEPSAPPPEG